MLGLFRDVEHLVRSGTVDDRILRTLTELDTAESGKLLKVYNTARGDIRAAMQRTGGSDPLLVSVEKNLDLVTHSKQQGRDIVELLSLVAFAAVTAGIGLLARPNSLDVESSWAGFLSEVFIVLFVSTVVFLCVNLFDIRRNRESPLLVPIEQHGGDYGLFFRRKRNLTVQHVTAVLISVVMAITFCALLYDKWLGPV